MTTLWMATYQIASNKLAIHKVEVHNQYIPVDTRHDDDMIHSESIVSKQDAVDQIHWDLIDLTHQAEENLREFEVDHMEKYAKPVMVNLWTCEICLMTMEVTRSVTYVEEDYPSYRSEEEASEEESMGMGGAGYATYGSEFSPLGVYAESLVSQEDADRIVADLCVELYHKFGNAALKVRPQTIQTANFVVLDMLNSYSTDRVLE